MATKIYLDKRSAKKDGTYPLKISVSYKGAYTLIPTGIYLLPEHWDETSGKSSVSCPLKPSDSAPLKHSTMPP